jgi:hypothetical protein
LLVGARVRHNSKEAFMSEIFGNAWDWVRDHSVDSGQAGSDPIGLLGNVTDQVQPHPVIAPTDPLGIVPVPNISPLPQPASDASRLGPTQTSQQDQAIDLSAPVLRYPDAQPVVDPNTGKPYPAPRGMDVSANAAEASGWAQSWGPAKDLWMVSRFFAGRPEDYQRPDGFLPAILGDDIIRSNRDVSGYNFGAVARRAGYPLEDALQAAGLYNRVMGRTQSDVTRYGIQKSQVDSITQGWNDGPKW